MEGEVSTFSRISRSPEYEGKWVVILGRRVLFSGNAERLKSEVAKIRKEHPGQIPLIARVPARLVQIV